MSDKNPEGVNQKSPRTLTDDQIVTERKLPRRSFLTATGTLLVGGAAAIVAGTRAAAQDAAQKAADPDAKKTAADPDAKKTGADPDAKKTADPDAKKSAKSRKAKKAKKSTAPADPDAAAKP